MVDNKKDIIIQVEIANNIYTEIDKLKKELSTLAPTTQIKPVLDTSNISKQDWDKDLAKFNTINIKSSLDKGFHLNIKNAKQALNSLKTDATIPIKITPVGTDSLAGVTRLDWEKLSPPGSISQNIKTLNSALTSLTNRLSGRKIAATGETKSLATIINETAAAFSGMAASAASAAAAVGGIKTAGIASDPTKSRAGGKKSKFDISTFSPEEQRYYFDKSPKMNARELGDLQKFLAGNAKQRSLNTFTGDAALNNFSGMQDMGGLKGAMARVLLFGSATSVLYGGIAAIRKAIDVTVNLENEMVQLQKVMDDTTPFDQMKKTMFDLSETFGVNILQITKLAKIWAQQGYDMVSTMKLTEVSMMAMNALNIDSAQSTDFLTSVTRVWGVELNGLKKVMASVMKVQADYAIESEDLTVILTKIGSGVRSAGDSMAFLAGASTALRETTRKSASQIFTSLKTIYAKSFGDDVIKALADVGVYAKMSTDQFRPFNDILAELAGKWGQLTDTERKHLAIVIGQTRYWSDFVALMENFSIVQSATLSFYRAWDEASKASELQQKSLKNTLQGVFSSFSKIGDTFGTKFFTPLIKSISGPIKAVADLLSKLGGAQTALVFAVSLKLLSGAFKTVFGHFPAYEKFLGRSGLAGAAFARSVIAQRTAMMASISAGTKYGATIRYIANNMELLTKTAGTAKNTVLAFSVAMARLKAVTALVWTSVKGLLAGFARFTLWTAAFWAAGEALGWLISKFSSAESAARKFAESLPEDVIEKINSLGKTDSATGRKVTAFDDTKRALDILIPKLIERQKELSTENKKYILTWQDVESVISTLDSKTIQTLKGNYGDLLKSVEDQKKIWEDIQTVVAITQNLVWGDTIKKASELKTKLTAGLTSAISVSKEFGDAFKEATGLSEKDFDSNDKIIKAISDNMEEISRNPKLHNLAVKLSKIISGQEIKIPIYQEKLGYDKKVFSESQINDIAKVLAFALSPVQEKFSQYIKLNPVDILSNSIIGDLNSAKFKSVKEMHEYGQDVASAVKMVNDTIDKQVNDITGIGDINNLRIINKGKKTEFGELFIDSPGKASKAFGELRSELEKIKLLYNAGAIFPEDILKEQQKAYSNYSNEIISEFQAANHDLEVLSKKRTDIISIIQADPNSGQFMKDYKPGTDIADYLVRVSENSQDASDDVAENFNEAAVAAEKSAAAGLKYFAENAKKLKGVIADEQEQKKNLLELTTAYNNLKSVALEPLAKINALLGKQSVIQKILKSNQEYLDKTAIDYLKNRLELEKQVNDVILDSERIYATTSGGRTNYKLLEASKRKELELHRYYALKENEINIEKQKREVEHAKTPRLIAGKFISSAMAELFNARNDIENADREGQLSNLDDVKASNIEIINQDHIMYTYSQRLSEQYAIWNDHLKDVQERTDFIKDTIANSITDFSRINETHGLSVLTDTIGKIGKRFQEEQAKIFINSVIHSKLGAFVLPSEEDIKFTERLTATSAAFYNSVYSAMHAGVIEMASVLGKSVPINEDIATRAKLEQEASSAADIKKFANIAAIGNLASTIGLSFLNGNEQGKQQGSQIGSILGAVLPKLLGASPIVGSIASVVGLLGGGVIGSLLGGKQEQKQDTMIGQLKLIEQNTARVADLTDKLVNIPGSVFLPPTGGFMLNGNIVINANGISNPQQVVDMTVNRLSREFGLAARRSGSRGNIY